MPGLNGTDVLLLVNTGTEGAPIWTSVGSQRDVTIGEEVDLIDTSSKDAPEATYLGGRYGATISLDQLYVPSDAAYTTLKTKFRARATIKVRIRESGTDKEEATCIINSLERNFPDQEESTVSIELTLTGGFTTI